MINKFLGGDTDIGNFRTYIIDRYWQGKWKRIENNSPNCGFRLEKESGDDNFMKFVTFIEKNCNDGEMLFGNYKYSIKYQDGEAISIIRLLSLPEKDCNKEGACYENCPELEEILEPEELFQIKKPRMHEITEWIQSYGEYDDDFDRIDNESAEHLDNIESELTDYDPDGVYVEEGYWYPIESSNPNT